MNNSDYNRSWLKGIIGGINYMATINLVKWHYSMFPLETKNPNGLILSIISILLSTTIRAGMGPINNEWKEGLLDMDGVVFKSIYKQIWQIFALLSSYGHANDDDGNKSRNQTTRKCSLDYTLWLVNCVLKWKIYKILSQKLPFRWFILLTRWRQVHWWWW